MDRKPLDPGCDRYTRPEEIAALSKFLGEVKAVQEEYIEKFELDDKPDEMLGEHVKNKLETYIEPLDKGGGTMPKIKLGDTVLGLDGVHDIPLSDHTETLTDERVNRLDNTVVGLKGISDNAVLDKTVVPLEGIPEEGPELSEYVEKIKVPGVSELPDYIETIAPTDVPLSDYIEKIEVSDVPLSDYVEPLETGPDTPLSDYIEGLAVSEGPGLGDTVLSVPGKIKDQELDQTVLKIKPGESTPLSDYVEGLSVKEKVTELPDYVDPITTIRDTDLSEHVEKLEGVEDLTALPEKVETIETHDIPLSDHLETIKVEDVDKLSDHIEKISPSDIELDDHLDKIEVPDQESLPDTVLGLGDVKDVELGNYIEKLGGVTETDLSETLIPVPGEDVENELGNTVIGISGNVGGDVEELSDYREGLEVPDNAKLSDTVIGLSGVKDIGLEDTVLGLSGIKDVPLSNTVIPLGEVTETELPDKVLNIEGIPEVDLPDTVLGLDGVTDKELPDTVLPLTGVTDVDLPDVRLDIEPSDVELPNTVLKIEPKDVELGDTILKIEPKDVELPDTRLDIEPKEVELSDVRLDISPEDVELPDVRLDIEPKDVDLPNTVLPLNGIPEVELPETVLGLDGVTDKELPDTVLNIPTENPRDGRIDSDSVFPERLADYVSGNVVPDDERQKVRGKDGTEVTELPEGIKGVGNEGDQLGGLDNSPLDLPNNVGVENEPDEEDITNLLSNFPFPEAGNLNPRLSGDNPDIRTLDNLPEAPIQWVMPTDEAPESYEEKFEERNSEFDEDGGFLPDHQSRVASINDGLEVTELPEDILGRPENANETDVDEVFEERIQGSLEMAKDFGGEEIDDNSEVATLRKFTNPKAYNVEVIEKEQQLKFKLLNELEKTDDSELFNTVLGLTYPESGDRTEFDKKMAGLISSYLSSASISPQRSADFQRKFEAAFNLPAYDGDNMYRKLAEKAKSVGTSYASRRDLLETTLWALLAARNTAEEVTGLSKSALPGGIGSTKVAQNLYKTLSGDVGVGEAIKDTAMSTAKTAIKAGVGALLGEETHENPQNYPQVNRVLGVVSTGITETTGWEPGNSRSNSEKSALNKLLSVAKSVGKSLLGDLLSSRTYKFKPNYIDPLGVKKTLADLCENSDPGTVEELFQVLKDSPYITTPSKFGTVEKGNYKVMSLDSNAYWEVVLEPLCDQTLNGGFSYLPAFHEINTTNLLEHGAVTDYSTWVPVNSFDLQKEKVNTKSLSLYDGEISYPVSVELTNELKLTIVDDQYKSWKTYFETCAEVGVYNSTPHQASYYQDSGNAKTTVIDKTNICIALYKNIAFRCRIYIMTPQYSTIRHYDLLVVMKDFAEEYSGEVDAGGSDLTVSFSIVGESPMNTTSTLAKTASENFTKDKIIAKTRKANKKASKIKTYLSILS